MDNYLKIKNNAILELKKIKRIEIKLNLNIKSFRFFVVVFLIN